MNTSYPYMNLARCVYKLETTINRYGRAPVPREEFAKRIGFTAYADNSSAKYAVASLEKFNLIEISQPHTISPSPLCLRIVGGCSGTTDYQKALHECAFTPPLFKLLSGHFGDGEIQKLKEIRDICEHLGLSIKHARRAANSYYHTLTYLFNRHPNLYHRATINEVDGQEKYTMIYPKSYDPGKLKSIFNKMLDEL